MSITKLRMLNLTILTVIASSVVTALWLAPVLSASPPQAAMRLPAAQAPVLPPSNSVTPLPLIGQTAPALRMVEPQRASRKAAPPTAPRATSKVEAIIQFALAQVGKPYVWGAAGPNSFDCSGLVLSAFSKVGIHLPHFTGAMIVLGKAIGRQALQRGDIVFPQKGHVAIYLGNGQMVHAPQPGELVKVSKVYGFYAGRRLL